MESTSTESSANLRAESLMNIFHTMDYNKDLQEDFLPLMKWLSQNTSIVGSTYEEWNKMEVEHEHFSIGSNIEGKVMHYGESFFPTVRSQVWKETRTLVDREQFNDLVDKLFKAVSKRAEEVSIAGCLGYQVPLWQARKFIVNRWQAILEDVKERYYFLTDVSASLRFMKQRYCGTATLDRLIIEIFTALTAYSSKQTIICLEYIDAMTALSAAYCVDLLDLEGKIKLVFSKSDTKSVDPESCSPVLNVDKVRDAAHFIIDNTADVVSAVDNVASMLWLSPNTRSGRSLVFVHQSLQSKVASMLKLKLASIRVKECYRSKNNDYIPKKWLPDTAQKLIQSASSWGVPEFSNVSKGVSKWSAPIMFVDIGTSSPLVAVHEPFLNHVACLIPYRSKAELVSLSNNHEYVKDIFVYGSFHLQASLKGNRIFINSSMDLPNTTLLLSEARQQTILGCQLQDTSANSMTGPLKNEKDAEIQIQARFRLTEAITVAVTAQKQWSKLGMASRQASLCSASSDSKNLYEESDVLELCSILDISVPKLNHGLLRSISTEPKGLVALIMHEATDATKFLTVCRKILLSGSSVLVLCSEDSIQKITEIKCFEQLNPKGVFQVVSYDKFVFEKLLQCIQFDGSGNMRIYGAPKYENIELGYTELRNSTCVFNKIANFLKIKENFCQFSP